MPRALENFVRQPFYVYMLLIIYINNSTNSPLLQVQRKSVRKAPET